MFGLQNPHVTKQSILNCSHLFLSFFFSQKSSDSSSSTTPSHSYKKVFRKVAGVDTVIKKMDTLSLFLNDKPLALDTRFVQKISKKRHSFKVSKILQLGISNRSRFFSTNMVSRGVESFCILKGATFPLIEQ